VAGITAHSHSTPMTVGEETIEEFVKENKHKTMILLS